MRSKVGYSRHREDSVPEHRGMKELGVQKGGNKRLRLKEMKEEDMSLGESGGSTYAE